MTGAAGVGSLSEPSLDSRTGPTWADQSTGWHIFRVVLIVIWLTLMAIAVAVGERSSSYAQLKADIFAGRVHTVRVAGDLQPHAIGYATVEVHWRHGLFNYETNVIAARPRKRAPRHPMRYDATAVVTGSVAAQLTALEPDLRVTRSPHLAGHASIGSWQLPSWMLEAALLLLAGTLVLLGGPRPWRATRWAWFWLIMIAAPVGVPAFLILSGPAPPLPAPRRGARGLTGGWAFLLAIVLHKMLP